MNLALMWTIAVQLFGIGVIAGMQLRAQRENDRRFSEHGQRFGEIEKKVNDHGESISAIKMKLDIPVGIAR